ncbi:ABC transporter ATP-binding protein [PVC group bacterium]|nr:ABC transporter ATP-binding protein [PVC group bacterium]
MNDPLESDAHDSIAVEGLAKTFGNIRAVDGISFHVRPGEIFGFLGPNGAGKTTTINVMTGIALPTEGQVAVNGYDVVRQHVQAKQQLGVVCQHINLDPDLTARENLQIHGLLFRMRRAEIRARADELLEFVDLNDRASHRVQGLSGGMKRRLQIARALMHHPRILVLDEPTVGLDAHARRDIWAVIRRISAEGATVFLTTHYIEEAEALCHRVAIIDHGKIIALDTPPALVAQVGAFSVDVLQDERLETRTFGSRDEAVQFAAESGDELIVRRASLEDFFLQRTGRRIEH